MDYKKVYENIINDIDLAIAGTRREQTRICLENIKQRNTESEDERIRKEIISHAIAWLEKQKDEAQRQFNLGIQAVREEVLYEMEKEQKPVLTKIDNSKENVVFPFNARVKDSDKMVTIVNGQLSFDGKQWIRFSSNREDGFKVYRSEDLLVEQKPAEWSEEDDINLNACIQIINDEWKKAQIKELGTTKFAPHYYGDLIDWLKSLRPQPHWKPSEEQMVHLAAAVEESNENPVLNSLYNDLKKL